MGAIVTIIKDLLIPGTTSFLLFGLIVGVILLFAGKTASQWGRGGLVVLALLYWFMSTSFGSNLLESSLTNAYVPLQDFAAYSDIDAVVVLGGGSVTFEYEGQGINVLSRASALRALEGARLFSVLDSPMVIVSGGMDEHILKTRPESEALSNSLIMLGVPREKIVLESKSMSTYDQAVILHDLLEEMQIDQFILVTSPIHMHRSLAVFRNEGLDPIASASALHSEGYAQVSTGLMPSMIQLDSSRAVLRELLALSYYWVTGRL
jgi:uncharacterized SAM-binding protein YcdF (DUF218 family)